MQVPVEDKESETSEILHGNEIYEQTSKSLEELLKTLLDRDLNSSTLSIIFKHLEPWITSVNDHERLRSIRSLSSVLKHFNSSFKLDENNTENVDNFSCFGNILGRVVTRVTDPVIKIRVLAIDCIDSLLKSLQIFTKENWDESESLNNLKQNLEKNSPNILLTSVNDLSKILCKKIPAGSQLIFFIENLIDGLLDIQSNCSSSSCICLNYCIKLRGPELKEYVDNLLRHLYTKLGSIQNSQAKLGTLRTIRVVFQQHLKDSLNVLLTLPIPCSK